MSKSGHETSVMRDPLLDRARDTSRPILLIGFLHQENLGLGYLSAMLRRYGYKVVVLDFEAERRRHPARRSRVQPADRRPFADLPVLPAALRESGQRRSGRAASTAISPSAAIFRR